MATYNYEYVIDTLTDGNVTAELLLTALGRYDDSMLGYFSFYTKVRTSSYSGTETREVVIGNSDIELSGGLRDEDGYEENKNISFTSEQKTETINKITGKYGTLEPDGTLSVTVTVNTKASLTNDGGTTYDSFSGDYVVTIDFPSLVSRQTDILTATNFNDEGNPTITYALADDTEIEGGEQYSVLTGLQACISFDGTTPDIPYRDIPTDGVSYTFNLTDADRTLIRNKVQGSTSKPIYFIIKTTRSATKTTTGEILSSKDIYTSVQRTVTVIGCNPVVAPTVVDSNTKTIALTGDNNIFVKYHSHAKYVINATASKNATITHQAVSCGEQYRETATGVLYSVEKGTFVFYAVDSRELITSEVVEKEFVDYTHLTCNIARKTSDPDGNISFSIYGNYFAGVFGAKTNNIFLKYRYKTGSGSYGSWVSVVPTVNMSNNTYSIDITLTGLDYRNNYTVQATVSDTLESIDSEEVVIKVMPLFDWSSGDFNFNVPITFTDNSQNEPVVYSVSDAVMGLHGLDLDSVGQIGGLVKAMSNRYELPCEVGAGVDFSSVQCNLYLYGNTIRGYLNCVRNSASGTGDLDNRIVCGVTFDSGGKVKGFGQTSFCSGGKGTAATFSMADTVIYQDDGSVDESQVGKGYFNIYLTAAAQADTEWQCFFTFPCTLDLTKF